MIKEFLLKVNCLFVLFLLCGSSNLWAAGNPITGTILDAETKEPLPYASVGVLGKHIGTVSNSEGNFLLDAEGITSSDTILFRYVGYEALRIQVFQLQKNTTVYLKPVAVNLNEVVVTRSLPPEEIIRLAYTNFEKNHASTSNKQRIVLHKYGKIPLHKENKLVLQKTNFVGLDKKTFEELLKKMPKEFNEYQDAIVDLYRQGDQYKLVPVKAISLEEGSQQALMEEFENKLGDFFEDIDKSMGEKDIYYKVRSGIFSKKIGNKRADKADWNNNNDSEETDTLNYTVQTEQAKEYLLSLLKEYASVESDNWEFINKPNKYEYTLEGAPFFNDELAYKISFTPKKRGLFEGTVYISTSSYALLQLDFAFAKDKKSDTYNLLGYKHATNFRGGHIIFEKGESGYFVKYMNARQKTFTSLDRNFSIMKKQKRLLLDKELNEFKLEAEIAFNSETYWELLVLEREEISDTQYEKVKEPSHMKFKKEYAYTSDMWENRTVIVPSTELKKYKRK